MTTKQTEYQQRLNDAIALDRIAAENAVNDVSNLGDYDTMTIKTSDGKEIEYKVYGR